MFLRKCVSYFTLRESCRGYLVAALTGITHWHLEPRVNAGLNFRNSQSHRVRGQKKASVLLRVKERSVLLAITSIWLSIGQGASGRVRGNYGSHPPASRCTRQAILKRRNSHSAVVPARRALRAFQIAADSLEQIAALASEWS